MGRIFSVMMALLLLSASGVGAGTFGVMSEAKGEKLSSPVYIPPTVVKAEFKSNLKSDSALDLETEPTAGTEPDSATRSGTKDRVAPSSKSRAPRGMAPSPDRNAEQTPDGLSEQARKRGSGSAPYRGSRQASKSKTGSDKVAQKKQSEQDIEKALEDSLVIQPPQPQAEGEKETNESTESAEERGAGVQETERARGKKASRKGKEISKKPHRGGTSARPSAGPPPPPSSVAGKPVRKVKPLTGYMWNTPAGTWGPGVSDRGPEQALSGNGYGAFGNPVGPQPLISQAKPRAVSPEMASRFVREGVTIKLAPRTVLATYPNPQMAEGSTGSELVATVTEIIGLPFAFISSLF